MAPSHAAARASAVTTQASNGGTVTKITVIGRFAELFLSDGDTNGQLTASQDRIANTSAVDFSYASPDPANADQVILIQGAGEIPNSALTLTSSSAHLAVTTSFPINRCIINLVTGQGTCGIAAPSSFNLTWVKNGFGSLSQKEMFRQTLGPVTTKFQGSFVSVTADVNGTWDGHTTVAGPNAGGDLLDTQNTTIIREVTLAPTP
jgi:hypothetical protein